MNALADVAVLIHTYDAIKVVFPYIVKSVAHNMPQETYGSSWRLYFANEEIVLDEALLASLPVPVTQLKTGRRKNRSFDYVSSFLKALRLLPEEFVLYLQEDMFLDRPVRTDEFDAVVALARRLNAGVVYLWHETRKRCKATARNGETKGPRVRQPAWARPPWRPVLQYPEALQRITTAEITLQ